MKKLIITIAALLLAGCLCCWNGVANAAGCIGVMRTCYSRIYDRTHLAKHPDQSVSAMRISLSASGIAEDLYDFDLSVQFCGDNEKWQWRTYGACYRFGPGMTCVEILDGCDTKESNHFYINHNTKKPNTLDLYPSQINLYKGELIDAHKRILNQGKDDKIFRLDKTACWKEEANY